MSGDVDFVFDVVLFLCLGFVLLIVLVGFVFCLYFCVVEFFFFCWGRLWCECEVGFWGF